MFSFLRTALLAAPFALHANAHYIFSQLVVNDELIGGDYSYIRQNTNSYEPSFTDEVLNSEDMRCNKGATNVASETYDVSAGDKIGFKLFFNEFIEHPGPGFIYMSLAPNGDVSSYDGSGDWFKVWESGLSGSASDEANWGTWQQDRMEFTIPMDIPDGEYLVRPEHIGIHEGHVGKAQFYMECAQLRISGGGNGSPGPMTQFPGAYTADEVNFDMWSAPVPSTYVMPGPAVWTGGGSTGGSTTTNSSTSDDGSFSAPAASSPPTFSTPAAQSGYQGYNPSTFATVASGAPAPVFSNAPVSGFPAAQSVAAPVASAPVGSAPVGYSPAAVPSGVAGCYGGSPYVK